MISDKNKNITSVAYNHLDLPVRIVFGGDLNTRVDYAYDALGAKLQKTVVQYNPVGDHSIVLTSVTDYLGFQYKDGVLQFFPTSEGYVSHTKGSYSYVYNYTDHLGNVRMSYTKNPANPSELKIIEENHYYPFGLKHENYNSEEFLFEKKGGNLQLRAPVVKEVLPYQYKYNGKEFQDELGLNLYDFGARNYDPALGRWMNIDPLAEKGRRWSPYNYAMDNPVYFIDPDGMWPGPGISQWIQSYAKGAWTTGSNMIKGAVAGTYNGIKNGINAGQKVTSAYKAGGFSGAAKQYGQSVYETSGAKNTVETVKKASQGDPEAIGSVVTTIAAIALTRQVGKGGSVASIESGEAAAQTGSKSIFSEAGKVESLAESKNIKSMQSGLRSEKVVGEILDKMKSPEGFDVSKYPIGGYLNEGTYYIGEGNHRMAAGLQYQVETGSSMYVDQLLKTGQWYTEKGPTAKTYNFSTNTDF